MGWRGFHYGLTASHLRLGVLREFRFDKHYRSSRQFNRVLELSLHTPSRSKTLLLAGTF